AQVGTSGNPESGGVTLDGGILSIANGGDLCTATSKASISTASESGNTVTIATSAAHDFTVGQTVLINNVGVAGYNGTFTVASVPDATHFTYNNPSFSSLTSSGSGTALVGTSGPAPTLTLINGTLSVPAAAASLAIASGGAT